MSDAGDTRCSKHNGHIVERCGANDGVTLLSWSQILCMNGSMVMVSATGLVVHSLPIWEIGVVVRPIVRWQLS